MNEVHQRKLTITFYTWEPFSKQAQKEEDELIMQLKTKKLLPSAGHVKTAIERVEE